jgi:hypothetical protein
MKQFRVREDKSQGRKSRDEAEEATMSVQEVSYAI